MKKAFKVYIYFQINLVVPQSKIVETAVTSVVTTTTNTTITSTTAATASSSESSEDASTPNPAAVVEIPFVPPSQRPTIVEDPVTKENVVVVGRQKKRKRKDKNKESADTDIGKETEISSAPSKKQKGQDSRPIIEKGTVEPYDFSAEKNILDESSSFQADSASFLVGKKRKDKKGSFYLVYRRGRNVDLINSLQMLWHQTGRRKKTHLDPLHVTEVK